MGGEISSGICAKIQKVNIYGKLKRDAGNISGMLCKRKGIEIIEAKSRVFHDRVKNHEEP